MSNIFSLSLFSSTSPLPPPPGSDHHHPPLLCRQKTCVFTRRPQPRFCSTPTSLLPAAASAAASAPRSRLPASPLSLLPAAAAVVRTWSPTPSRTRRRDAALPTRTLPHRKKNPDKIPHTHAHVKIEWLTPVSFRPPSSPRRQKGVKEPQQFFASTAPNYDTRLVPARDKTRNDKDDVGNRDGARLACGRRQLVQFSCFFPSSSGGHKLGGRTGLERDLILQPAAREISCFVT